MNVVFRVDASVQMGTGHFMRCLALAESLRERGVRVRFICREHIGNLIGLLQLRAIPSTILPAPSMSDMAVGEDYAAWLGVTQLEDAEQTIEALKGEKLDFLVVDHYGLDVEWERRLRLHVHKIMVIDDLANRRHDCDVLLDQNYSDESEKRYVDFVPEKCRLMLGTRYALLRPEYVTYRKALEVRDGGVKRVLVFLGGSDPQDITGMALDALSDPVLRHLQVDVVVGANYLHRNSLEKRVRERQNTRIYGPRPHLADLMVEADVAIGAGGATTWERMCLGLPTVLVSTAENQLPASEALAKAKLVHYAGHISDVNADTLKVLLITLSQGQEKNVELAKKNQVQVDGLGVLRVCEVLCSSPSSMLRLRPTCEEDIIHYYYWVNDQSVPLCTNQTRGISFDQYKKWFVKKLNDVNSRLFVLEVAGLAVGQIRFDVNVDEASIDYSLDEIVRARGWCLHLISLGSEMMRGVEPVWLRSELKASYATPSSIFLRLGFTRSKQATLSRDVRSIGILSDRASWINEYLHELRREWLLSGHSVLWVHDKDELLAGDFCFYLGCGQIVPTTILSKFQHNLVAHESDLPKGKGWSPLTWQILEGRSRLPVTLIEAVETVDCGDVYAQEWLNFDGHELVDELRKKQAEATVRLCKKFVSEYPNILKVMRNQVGAESFFPRRRAADSELDPSMSIESQFNLLRVVDNDRYPAFFEHQGRRFYLKIQKN